ncbi:unnamed protein product [Mycena citricolor]|uniref:Uncharacterized protein n=1 Tax=Mycena citricolor TaxID=2018698 RepID=A0AAD2K3F8_9AGAR|nr:unnamed protein product [Mycena citricolor]CAK5276802.1 unnamed protein product [Mycena citricolor]
METNARNETEEEGVDRKLAGITVTVRGRGEGRLGAFGDAARAALDPTNFGIRTGFSIGRAAPATPNHFDLSPVLSYSLSDNDFCLLSSITLSAYSVEEAGVHQLYPLLKSGSGAWRTNDKGNAVTGRAETLGTKRCRMRCGRIQRRQELTRHNIAVANNTVVRRNGRTQLHSIATVCAGDVHLASVDDLRRMACSGFY